MAKKNVSYEEMMHKLEGIVTTMESTELTLDDSITNYEEGMKLCNSLYKTLSQAESKIKILTEQGEKDFLSNEE
jgi:exodeoxyribonuclease VII small subunit